MNGVRKYSVSLSGHRTSFSLETAFFTELQAIAARRGQSLAALVGDVDATRGEGENLSSALRVFVLRDALERVEGAPAGSRADPSPVLRVTD
jgi:predicted DNA-binding ribbon-helix-helix protein